LHNPDPQLHNPDPQLYNPDPQLYNPDPQLCNCGLSLSNRKALLPNDEAGVLFLGARASTPASISMRRKAPVTDALAFSEKEWKSGEGDSVW
jgi:hypothetical protein